MKAFLVLLVVLGTSMALGAGGAGGLGGKLSGLFRNKFSNVNISDFNAVRNLFNRQSSGGKELLLQAAAQNFFIRFRDSVFLAEKTKMEIIKNFIDNARNIMSQAVESSWTPGLDIDLLGMSQSEFQSLLTATPPARSESGSESEGEGQGQGEVGSVSSSRQGQVGSVSSSRQKRQALPKSVDWRKNNAVTPVKNQGKCGSCWAFAAVGALEGRLAVKTGKLNVLSEQNLIDCTKNVGEKECCQGCTGGWMTDGYTYVQENDGITSNASYPYEAKDGQCRYNAANKAGDALGFKYTNEDDEEDLMRAVAEGPVAVAVDATQWSAYKTGVFRCRTILNAFRSNKINHGVVIVGYDSSLLWGDYWIVKNSWGPSWGENGYIRIARNAGNQCGIAGAGNYPLV